MTAKEKAKYIPEKDAIEFVSIYAINIYFDTRTMEDQKLFRKALVKMIKKMYEDRRQEVKTELEKL